MCWWERSPNVSNTNNFCNVNNNGNANNNNANNTNGVVFGFKQKDRWSNIFNMGNEI